MAIFQSKAVTKDKRKWYFSVWYLSANGEKKRKKSQRYASRTEAQEAERNFLTDIIKHNRIDMTYREMYDQYLDYTEESIKGSTKYCKINRNKNHILNYFGEMNIHNITVNTVIAWKSKINKKTYGKGKRYSLQYKQTLMVELGAVLNYGVNFCGLKENPARKVKNFQDKSEAVISDEEKIRYITPDEYNLFTSVIDKLVFKVFFAFLYYMGVRKGEAQALTWEDILWDMSKVRIIKTVTSKTDELDEHGHQFKITNTKNRKNRTIQMPPILKFLLLELYQYYMAHEGFSNKWFVFGGYKHLPSKTIDTEKDRYFDLAKATYEKEINRITNHEFRHSHASYLISRGVKIELIAYRLGDTVGVVQKTYAHLFPEVEDAIIEELDLIEDTFIIKGNLIAPPTKKEFLKPPRLKNPLLVSAKCT